jgi:hypothetical protein
VALGAWQMSVRAREYGRGLFTMKLHPDRQAREAGIHDALIFVAESWASRLLVRLLAWGVPSGEVERAYHTIDSCELDEVLQEAERRAAAVGRARARDWLRRELAVRRDRSGGVELPRADTLPDPTLRLAPGRPLTARCRKLLAQDYEGFSVFTPFLPLNAPTFDGDLVFARDLRERNVLLMAQHPNRSYYRYTPGTPAYRVVPRFVPIPVPEDSIEEARTRLLGRSR